MPIRVPPIPFIPRRKRRTTSAPASAPALVSATFGGSGDPTLTLAFDRAIDVAGFVPGGVVVYDGPGAVEWGGTGVFEQPTPESLSVTMSEQGEFTGAGVTLAAAGGAGIVAADDDTPWAGVEGLGLPYPE